MRIKPCLLVVILVALAIAPVFADGMFVQSPLYPGDVSYTYSSQLGISGSSTSIPVNAVLQAIGNTDYPVTPGDSFTLAYSDGKNLVTLELQADSDCRVMIQSVGVVEAAGLTYREFKLQVEDLISKYYTYSAAQLVLKNCGVFSVRVSGEVNFTQYVTAWGLSRLSDLADYATRFASTRSVTLITKDGTSRDYDLYAALRDDSFEDNPLLSPGCEVRFNKASSIISLGGAVKSPGVYQPLAGQTLYQVIESYGDGLLNSADERVISVSNFQNGQYSARQLSMEQAKSYVPADGDSINITSGSQVMPYVTITGALASESATNLTAASRINYNFIPGETALQLVRNIAPRLLATSDTSAIYILRGSQKIYVDASAALTSAEIGDIYLEQGDIVVIPFSQLTVTVTGAVRNPGSFTYVPDRNTDYYINLAGGFSDVATQGVKVLDKDGNKIKDSTVPADSTIVANKTNITNNIALVASILSIVSTVLTIVINGHTIATW
jgi:protein involved in polysaccharide export with SLBB domain